MIEFTKDDLDRITAASRTYSDSIKNISDRRLAWTSGTKERVKGILEEIKKNCKLANTVVEEAELMEHLGGLNIGFFDNFSGLVIRTDDQQELLKKEGGRLCFSQGYNGRIYVFIIYPRIPGYAEPVEPTKLLQVVEPKDLTQDYILEKFVKFLEEMSKWEGEDQRPIGFNQ
jgi:hypothetical protein